MLGWRLFAAVTVALLSLTLTTCRSGETREPPPKAASAAPLVLEGVDTHDLTQREKAEWSTQVSQLLAPCRAQPVSLAQCVKEQRACSACLPAVNYIVAQVRRGLTGHLVEAAYRARFDEKRVYDFDLSGSPHKGPEDAPITIVEFADFECPACAAMQPILDDLEKEFPGKIRIVFKHFPLSIHPHAENAARSAVAAHRQNLFWQLHAKIFAQSPAIDPRSIERMAREVGLDMRRFAEDRESEATADAVARDRRQGEGLEIAATPSLFINGRLFVTASDPKADLLDWVELELELVGQRTPKAKGPAKAPTPAE